MKDYAFVPHGPQTVPTIPERIAAAICLALFLSAMLALEVAMTRGLEP